MFGERIGLSVWLYSLKHIKNLRRFGNVIYTSKKMKYAIIYCNRENIDETIEKLNSLHYVKAVQPSLKPFLKTEYEKVVDKEKEFELKIGL